MPKVWGEQVDFNLFPDAKSLAQARAAGTDANSQAADPMFLDPAKGDYRVKEESAARQLGFKHFATDRFGVLSAIGGLVGALLNARANSPALTMVFAALLLFAGFSGLTGFAERMRFGRKSAWIAGAISGLFGGMVGSSA